MAKVKWGTGALSASLRQGLKEVSQVIPAFKDSVQVVEEMGAGGTNLTPVEIYKAKLAQEAQNVGAKDKEVQKILEMEM
jgi:hypothetical protein